MEKRKTFNRIFSLAVAALYLRLSFKYSRWNISWLIWVAYAVFRFIAG